MKKSRKANTVKKKAEKAANIEKAKIFQKIKKHKIIKTQKSGKKASMPK